MRADAAADVTAAPAAAVEDLRPETLRDASLAFVHAYWNVLRGSARAPAMARVDDRVLASSPGAFLVADAKDGGYHVRSSSTPAPGGWFEAKAAFDRCIGLARPMQATLGNMCWIALPLAGDGGKIDGLLAAAAPHVQSPAMGKIAVDERIRLILDTLEQGVCIVDADGRIILHNKRLTDVLGLPEALLAGQPSQDDVIRFQASRGDLDAFGIDTEERIAHVAAMVQESTDPLHYERTSRAGRIIDARIWPLADGRQIRIFTDVTASRLAEHRLKASEALLAEILAGLDAEVAVYDAEEGFVLGNRRFRERHPYLPPDPELAGRKYADIVRMSVAAGAVHPQAAKDPETYVARRVLEWRQARPVRLEHDAASGTSSVVNARRTAEGATIEFRYDVTEQKRVERDLAAKSSLHDLVLDHMTEGLALYDQDLNIVFHNRQMRDIFGFPEELLTAGAAAERMARFLAIRGRYGGGDPQVQIERVLTGFRRKDAFSYEHTLPDGRVILVHHTPLPDGRLVRRYSDITARKRAEAELAAKTAALETTLESAGDGVAVFDADLRLVAYNRRALRYFDIPETELRKDPTAAGIIRYSAVRGAYGEGDPEEHVRQYLKSFLSSDPMTFTRTLSDGTVVEVHHNPLPDGRFVRRYADLGRP